ncbi:hypothetical protein VCRA2119O44_160025 [Vibrio crassostreae]|nr:hypothetical protein VCRA2119O44_160025 [Vibrio crassostreae]CAK2320799.1 hypothetical protein VCRA2119O386_230068 [Vibrio crassostreae]CAK2419538.1 hypothetical protein VCRA2116O32_160021 [Vibrio crassostreae]CAK2679460.1 hypothetical protein VCRA2117O375_200067 [Vibrio crassostreae]CAK3349623.1 hypothetical protein VCRA2120O388_220068 [Vibrio crassostreae]
MKRVFSMPPRAQQGFIDSVFRLAYVPLSCLHQSQSKLRYYLRLKRNDIPFNW